MHPVSKNKAAAKQGIALIVVLALLAMLVIMSVSFVVFMRAERTASRDYAELVKARNIAQAGITRAVVRMQQDMILPNQSNQFYHSGWIYTPSSAASSGICTNWLANGMQSNYVPATLAGNLSKARSVSSPVYWTNLVITTISGASQLIGRYSYMVFDCSDFLDINAITNQLRVAGFDPGEIPLPPLVGVPAASVIPTRTTVHPFESLCELSLRNGGISPQHLVTYSYVPVNSYFANNQQNGRLYIGTNPVQIASHATAIKAVATTLGLDTSFYDNLYDFANSSTDVPTNPNEMGGGKLVPMLYQIAATNGLRMVRVTSNVWEVETRVFYETWFPYAATANKSYSLRLSALPKLAAAPVSVPIAPVNFPWTPVAVSNGWQTTPAIVSATPPTILTPTNTFTTNSYVIVYRNTFTGTFTSASTTLSLPPIAYVGAGVGGAGASVDQATFPAGAQTMSFPGALANRSVPPQGWGVNDPRINWRATDWQQNTKTLLPQLLGITNEFCDVSGFKTDQNGDGSTFMYTQIPASTNLHSIGDLGYLLFDASKPWHTVRLFGPDTTDPRQTRQLFNMMTIIPTNRVYQGFINPNSQDTNALMCAFFNASKARYPGGLPTALITSPEAVGLASRLIALGIKSGNAAYTNIADVCRLTTNDFVTAGVADKDFWVNKAIMRNSIGLMNPRQNYWLVLVCAQAVKPNTATPNVATPANYFVTAEVQCLAYIWRDPYEDFTDTVHGVGSRRHKMFIQFFKWL
jgi:Tfp pilus assembly protein PilX